MKKRIKTLAAALLAILALTACGGEKFTCDMCGEEISGKRYEVNSVDGRMILCSDCKKEVEELTGTPIKEATPEKKVIEEDEARIREVAESLELAMANSECYLAANKASVTVRIVNNEEIEVICGNGAKTDAADLIKNEMRYSLKSLYVNFSSTEYRDKSVTIKMEFNEDYDAYVFERQDGDIVWTCDSSVAAKPETPLYEKNSWSKI